MNHSITFGQVVKERRQALGLTQAELARRARCAPVTVRKIESDALRPSVQLAELLAYALRVPEEEHLAFVRLARQQPPPSPIPAPSPSSDEIGQPDLSGRAVKGFELRERIGSGGFGVVYRAVQPSVKRDVAVKIILPRFANQPAFIRRFEAEAQLVARLEHPHIVPLYDYWREPNAAYLVMRLLRGGSLDDLLRDGPLTLEQVNRLALQIGTALDAAHHQGVVHRDIKPANVLLDEQQNAFLADFGIAKSLGDLEGGSPGAPFGSSPSYLAPEQIRGEPVRPYSDIYGFGLLLYEMLTGEQPFSGPTPVALLQQQLQRPVPLLRDVAPDLPPALDDVVQRATVKEPGERYPDIATLLSELEPALNAAWGDTHDTGLAGATAVPVLSAKDVAALENPFRGLRAFTEADTAQFFGRDTLVQELLDMLSDDSDLGRFAAVVGPSGSGKSSVVKAGLIPALRSGGLPGSENWFITELAPGSAPWEELAGALERVAVVARDDLLALLRQDARGLLRAVRRTLPDDGETELLLVIDQFEELFTLVEDADVRTRFLEALVTAVLEPTSRLRVVITLRADFTHRPLQFVDFGELMQQRMALVLPLTTDELTQAITRPVTDLGMALEPELVATIIRDVGDQPGTLPLLQFALTELFERRAGHMLTLKGYHSAGGVTGAVAGRADELYAALDDAGRQDARELFLRLITLGEGVEDTRRRVLRAELEALEATHMNAVLDAYGRYRLLTFDHDPATRGPTVEVAHEALLREWPRLRGWLRESREDVRQQRLLADAARQWAQADQDDSYLLRGSRLAAFETWVDTTTVALTESEQAFLQASIAASDRRQAAEEARRQRELETAQQLAEAERRRAEEQTQAARALRRRALFLAGAVVLAVILAIAAVGFARSSNNNASLAAQREVEALESYSLSLAANARQALEADDQELALLLALAANNVEDPPLTAWRTLVDIAYAPGVQQHLGADSALNAVAYSPNGRHLITGTDNGKVLLWDLESGTVEQTLSGHTAPVTAVAISPDTKFALSGSRDDTVILWDLETGALVHQLHGHKGDVSAIAFTPDGQRAVSGEDTLAAPGDLIVWDLSTGEVVRRFGGNLDGNPEGIRDLAISPDGRNVLVGGYSFADTNERVVLYWDIEQGDIVQQFPGLDRTVEAVAVSPNGRFGLAGATDAFVYLWNLESGEQVRRLSGHEGSVQAVDISPNGRSALSAGLDRTLIWWDLDTGEIISRFSALPSDVADVQFINDILAATTAVDGTLRIWDLTSEWQLARLGSDESGHLPPGPGTENRGMGLAISPDGHYVLSGGNDPDFSLILWDFESGEQLKRFENEAGSILDVEFMPDGTHALSANQNGTISMWDLQTGEQMMRLEGHQASVNALEVSSDGKRAISAEAGPGGMIYWDMETGKPLQRMIGHFEGRGTYDVAFLPGDQHAITGSWDGSMILWDLQSGEQVLRYTGLEPGGENHFSTDGDWGIHGISLSPDGTRLLSSGRDESLLLWDTVTGQSLQRFAGHASFVNDVEFHPNGHAAISAAQSDAVILWNADTGSLLRRYPLNNRLNSSFRPTIAMHPDGEVAIASDADGSLVKWRLSEPTTAELVNWIATNRHLRELSCEERELFGVEPLCVDGVSAQSTTDLLAGVGVSTATLNVPKSDSNPESQGAAWPTRAVRTSRTAVLGENRGELTRHDFDVWIYEGKEGEVLRLDMIADNPETDMTLPLEERNAGEALDTLLFVTGPTGELVTLANDGSSPGGAADSNASIAGAVLPMDGQYRIEARSYLDAGAGGYTLKIEAIEYEPDADLLEEYVGHFYEGPYEYDVFNTVEDGVLLQEYPIIAQTYPSIAIGPDEFLSSDGSRVVFVRNENGDVTGYKIWISLLHPIGGQWVDAIRLSD